MTLLFFLLEETESKFDSIENGSKEIRAARDGYNFSYERRCMLWENS